MSAAAIAGVVIGTLAALSFLLFMAYMRRRSSRAANRRSVAPVDFKSMVATIGSPVDSNFKSQFSPVSDDDAFSQRPSSTNLSSPPGIGELDTKTTAPSDSEEHSDKRVYAAAHAFRQHISAARPKVLQVRRTG